ncbi:hypothetical protein HHI36_006692, partial [Cryptolaemus montrouzieri]
KTVRYGGQQCWRPRYQEKSLIILFCLKALESMENRLFLRLLDVLHNDKSAKNNPSKNHVEQSQYINPPLEAKILIPDKGTSEEVKNEQLKGRADELMKKSPS